MAYIDYQQSLDIEMSDAYFRAIIMAAIRQADTDNLCKLALDFPDIARELCIRREAPGGCMTRREWINVHNNGEDLPEDHYPTERAFEQAQEQGKVSFERIKVGR